MEYHLISSSMSSVLETEINGHLRHGWKLLGETFSHGGLLCQAVIKKHEKKTLLEHLGEEEHAA